MKQEGKKFNLLLIAIISIFFIGLFNFSSFSATCDLPGDFVGPMGDPTPDGKVDFNDLMVFATAYGSEKGDLNWNGLCDLCGYLGDPNPDEKVNFDDLMIFATNYGKICPTAWTVMVYMDGDNNLEECYWQNLDMMESVGSTEEVSIVIQMDLLDDCAGTYRYYVTGVEAGSEYPLYPDDIVQSLPEQNMSDPATLTDFINWAGDNYPADHYMLILCDHGAGWREEDEIFKGIIWDDTTGGDEHIDIPELAQSLETANVNVDILGLDACNMQMIEVAWELGREMSTPPNYLIASENYGWAPAWPYDDFLAQLTGNPNVEQSAICETIVNGYINSFSTLPATMSTFHFNNEFLSNGLDIINNFANALLASTYQEEISSARSTAQAYVLWERPQYKDLYDFAQIIKNNVPDCQSEAQAVMDLVNNVIVAEGHTGPDMDNSHGLSIYLIDSPGEYDSNYDLLQFAIDTQWDEFLQSGEGVVTGVGIVAITRQLQTTGVEPETVSIFEEESNALKDYQIANINNGLKGETVNRISIFWDVYYDVEGYKVYKRINDGGFIMVYDWQNPPSGYSGYGVSDPDFSEGNTYSYYVTAYGADWETSPSEIDSIEITVQTFLPPCSLISPADNSIITYTNPVFSWSPVGLDTSDLPYGQVYSGETLLIVYDANTFEPAWYVWFDDMTASSVTYDQNGNAYPLVPGHNYRWYISTYGYDNNGNWVASSDSENWEFYYEGGVIPSSVYRAFLVGVGDYLYGDENDLPAPPFDVDMMRDTLSHSGDGFALINELKDLQATKSAILNGIASTFSEADADDVSYFYFTGHGALDDYNNSYLIPTDCDGFITTAISVNELDSALSAIPGTKVVFLDSCHSGGFIGKEINQGDIEGYSKNFNDDVINIFMTRDLANSQYQVLTSCLSSQTAIGLTLGDDSFGLFSAVLCEGCGYDTYIHPYPADGNINGEITLDEAYLYTDEQVNLIIDMLNAPPYEWDIDQDTQVYPLNSDFVIIEE